MPPQSENGSTKTKQQKKSNSGEGSIPFNLWAIGVLMAVAAMILAYRAYYMVPPVEVRPLKAPKLTALPEFGGDYKNRMLWGSYRSGLYFGMRTRSPKGLLTGLMWFDPDSHDTLMKQKVRHAASQEDRLASYGWVRHDGGSYGRQLLVDEDYNITLHMVKQFSERSGVGGDWAVRVSAQLSDSARAAGRSRKRISLVLYLGDEDTPTEQWRVLPDGEPDLAEPLLLGHGGSSVVGPWSLHLRNADSPGSSSSSRRRRAPRLDYLGLATDKNKEEYLLHVRELLMSVMYERLERNPTDAQFDLHLPNGVTTNSDLALFQLTFPLPGTWDFVMLSHRGSPDLDFDQERLEGLSGEALTALIAQRERDFDARFSQTFPLPQPQQQEGDDGGSSSSSSSDGGSGLSEGAAETAKAALSNLLGSMGYFYGSSLVSLPSRPDEPASYWPAPLFTSVPSRSFFPRGFLWDEGFHLMLLLRWEPRAARDVLAHWLDLINAQGWIPREQILGPEARQRVPAEFVVQDPRHANPPSLFLPIMDMARQLQSGSHPQHPELHSFLSRAWPRLEAWYAWFNTTQAGEEPTTFRWRGRNASTVLELNPKTLMSGLDDYPRASHPSSEERHLDLRCWMALASEAMSTIGSALGLPAEAVARYSQAWQALSDVDGLTKLHYDEARGQFSDWGLHSEGVRLVKHTFVEEGQPKEVVVRMVDVAPSPQFVPSYGYVSLFPLLMRLLPPGHPLLGQQLERLGQARELWTKQGLRSLSAQSSLYKARNTPHDPPYWRGQIWVNINYLALRALAHYRQQPGPHQALASRLYRDLRSGLLTNIVEQYMARGYLYEQYDDTSGAGMGSHPFTGWTALMALVATEQF